MASVEVLCGKGNLALAANDMAGARDSFADALIVANRGRSSSIRALLGLAEAARGLGDPAGAQRFADEALRVSDSVGNRRGRAWAREILGLLASDAGNDDEAWSALRESLVLYREVGDAAGMARTVAAVGGLALRRSLEKEGAVLLAAARAEQDSCGYVLTPAEQAAGDADLAAAAQLLPARRLAQALAAESKLPVEAAVELALRLSDLPGSAGS